MRVVLITRKSLRTQGSSQKRVRVTPFFHFSFSDPCEGLVSKFWLITFAFPDFGFAKVMVPKSCEIREGYGPPFAKLI